MLRETKILMLMLAVAAAAPVWADNDHNYTPPKGIENIMLFNPHEYDISEMTPRDREIFDMQRQNKHQRQHEREQATMRVMPDMTVMSGL